MSKRFTSLPCMSDGKSASTGPADHTSEVLGRAVGGARRHLKTRCIRSERFCRDSHVFPFSFGKGIAGCVVDVRDRRHAPAVQTSRAAEQEEVGRPSSGCRVHIYMMQAHIYTGHKLYNLICLSIILGLPFSSQGNKFAHVEGTVWMNTVIERQSL